MKIWVAIEAGFSVLGGAVAAFIGSYDGLVQALIIVMIADYITGVAKAVMRKTLSSEIGFKGIIRKFLMFLIIGVCNVIDRHLLVMLSFTGTDGNIVRDAVILFFIVNECISILENVILAGVPVPEQLKSILLQLRDNSSKSIFSKKDDKVDDIKPDDKTEHDYDNIDFDFDDDNNKPDDKGDENK